MGLFDFNKKKKEKQIEVANAKYSVQRDLEIIRESIAIIQETKVPGIFFSRYELLIDKANDLIVNSKYVSLNISPDAARNEALENKQKAIHDFLIRYWSDTLSKAEKLKTESAKQHRLENFFESLEEYKNEINEENKDFIITKYKLYINKKGE